MMPISIVKPDSTKYFLDKSDAFFSIEKDEERTFVEIRKATMREVAHRSELFSEFVQEFNRKDPGVERQIFRLPMHKLYAIEVYETLAACNIMSDDDTLFHFRTDRSGRRVLDMTEREFLEAWGLLEPMVAEEIHDCVIKENPQWSQRDIVPQGDEPSLGE
jgi:hypothetical protein